MNEENLTQCPICKRELYPYSIMGIMSVPYAYCPNCNIVKESYMSIPYLCDNCSAEIFYRIEEIDHCWLCGSTKFTAYKYEEAKAKGLFETEGYKLSTKHLKRKKEFQDCQHEANNIRHNETIFKFFCNKCGYVEYVTIPKWFQEREKIGDTIDTRNSSKVAESI